MNFQPNVIRTYSSMTSLPTTAQVERSKSVKEELKEQVKYLLYPGVSQAEINAYVDSKTFYDSTVSSELEALRNVLEVYNACVKLAEEFPLAYSVRGLNLDSFASFIESSEDNKNEITPGLCLSEYNQITNHINKLNSTVNYLKADATNVSFDISMLPDYVNAQNYYDVEQALIGYVSYYQVPELDTNRFSPRMVDDLASLYDQILKSPRYRLVSEVDELKEKVRHMTALLNEKNDDFNALEDLQNALGIIFTSSKARREDVDSAIQKMSLEQKSKIFEYVSKQPIQTRIQAYLKARLMGDPPVGDMTTKLDFLKKKEALLKKSINLFSLDLYFESLLKKLVNYVAVPKVESLLELSKHVKSKHAPSLESAYKSRKSSGMLSYSIDDTTPVEIASLAAVQDEIRQTQTSLIYSETHRDDYTEAVDLIHNDSIALDNRVSLRSSTLSYDIRVLPEILVHFFGDSFGSNSYLEGSPPGTLLDFLSVALNRYLDTAQNTVLKDVAESLRLGLPIRPGVQVYDMWMTLTGLQHSKSIIVPFGWSGSDTQSGHSTVLEITRTNTEFPPSFRVKHFNLGAGSSTYQDSRYNESKKQFETFSYVQYDTVSLDRLCSSVFLKAYNQLLTYTKEGQGFNETDMVAVLDLLGPMSKPDLELESSFQPLQNAGFCEWYSLAMLLKTRLSESEYADFYINTGYDILREFNDSLLREKELFTLSNLDIFDQCLETYLRETRAYKSEYSELINDAMQLQIETKRRYKEVRNRAVRSFDVPSSGSYSYMEIRESMDLPSLSIQTQSPTRIYSTIEFPRLDTIEDVKNFVGTVFQECKAHFLNNRTERGLVRVAMLASHAIQHLPPPQDLLWESVDSLDVFRECQRLTDITVRAFDGLSRNNGITHKMQVDAVLSSFQVLAIGLRCMAASSSHDESVSNWVNSITFGRDLKDMFDSSKMVGDSNLYSIHQYQRYKDLCTYFEEWDKGKLGHPVSFYSDIRLSKNPGVGSGGVDPFIQMIKVSYKQGEFWHLLADPETLQISPDMPQEYHVFANQVHAVHFFSSGKFQLSRHVSDKGWDVHDFSHLYSMFLLREFEDSQMIRYFNHLSLGSKQNDGHLNVFEISSHCMKHPWGTLQDAELKDIAGFRQGKGGIEANSFGNKILKKRQEKDADVFSKDRHDILALSKCLSVYSQEFDEHGIHISSLLSLFNTQMPLFLESEQRADFQAFLKVILLSDELNSELLESYNQLGKQLVKAMEYAFSHSLRTKFEDSVFFVLKMMIFLEPRLRLSDSKIDFKISEKLSSLRSINVPQAALAQLILAHAVQGNPYYGNDLRNDIVLAMSASSDPLYADPDLTYFSEVFYLRESLCNPELCHLVEFQSTGVPEDLKLDSGFQLLFDEKDQESLVVIEVPGGYETNFGNYKVYFHRYREAFVTVMCCDGEEDRANWHVLDTSELARKYLIDPNFVSDRMFQTSLIFIKRHSYEWDGSSSKAVLFFDRKTKSPVYQARIRHKHLVSLVRLRDNKEFLSKEDHPMSQLSVIESLQHIECLSGTSDRVCDEIHLTQLGISFRLDRQENCYVCTSPTYLAGSVIQYDQYVRGFDGFEAGIKIGKGDNIGILIPTRLVRPKKNAERFQFHKNKRGMTRFGAQYEFNHDLQVSPDLPPFLVVKDQPLVKAKNPVHQLFLIYIYMSIQSYEKAFQLLEQASSNPLPMTRVEKDLIKSILSINHLKEDPRGAALYLKVFLAFKDRESVDFIKSLVMPNFKFVLDRYLTNKDVCYHVPLTVSEEERAITYFKAVLQGGLAEKVRVHKPIFERKRPDNECVFHDTLHITFTMLKSSPTKDDFLNDPEQVKLRHLNILRNPYDNFFCCYINVMERSRLDEIRDYIQLSLAINPHNILVLVLKCLLDSPNSNLLMSVAELQTLFSDIDKVENATRVKDWLLSVATSMVVEPQENPEDAVGKVSAKSGENLEVQERVLVRPQLVSLKHVPFPVKIPVQNEVHKSPVFVEQLWHDYQESELAGRSIDALNRDIQCYVSQMNGKISGTVSSEVNDRERYKTQLRVAQAQLNKQLIPLSKAILRRVNKPFSKTVTLDDLSVAFAQYKYDSLRYSELNNDLSESDCARIHTMMLEYLTASLHKNKIQRLLTLLDSPDQNDALVEELRTTSLYDPQEYPEFMVFEYHTGFSLRPLQVSVLTQMLSGEVPNESIFQMIMGSGKTKVLLPILAFSIAQTGKLPVLVVPEALLEDVVADLCPKSSEIFRQKPVVFKFDRHTSLDPVELDQKIEMLEYSLKDKNYVITTSKSIHCLRLKYFELLHSGIDPNACKKLQKLLKMFAEKGHAIIDEADAILNCKNEVNFTIGIPIRPGKAELKSLVILHRFMREGASTNQLITAIQKGEFDCPEGVSNNGYFLMGFTDELRPDTDPESVSILYLYRQELNELLEVTTKKETYVNFGPDLSKKEMGAIPYVANNTPSKTSRFDQIHELLNYTIQMTQEIGVQDWILHDHVLKLHRDLKVDSVGTMKKISELFPGIDSMQFRNESQIPHIVKEIQSLFQHYPDHLDNYLIECVLPNITTNDQSLNSDSFDLVNMFSCVQGFTGTPWNSESFPHRINTVVVAGTDGESLSILKRNSTQVQVLNPKQESSPENLIESLELESNTRAFIDSGALLKGVFNHDVANLILTRVNRENPDIKEVVFYEGDNKKVLRLHEDRRVSILDFDKSKTPPEFRFTYYDQSHSVGSDIVQYSQAQAIVSIGHNLKLRDLFQGMWRMRGLSKDQSIKLLVSTKARSKIFGDITRESIIKFANTNQSEQLESHLLQSAPQQFSNPNNVALYTRLLTTDPESIKPEVIRLLVTTKRIEPEIVYATSKQKLSSRVIVDNISKGCTPSDELNYTKERVLQALPQECFYPIYPEGRETERELEVENEVEAELEMEKEAFASVPHLNRFKLPPYDQLSSFVKGSTSVSTLCSGFHQNLRMSKNWIVRDMHRSEFFLPCDYLLALVGRSGRRHVVMVHEWDVLAIMKSYKKYVRTDAHERPLQIGIFDAKTGDPYHMNAYSDCRGLKSFTYDHDFQVMAVQVKFLNGQIYFSENELEILKEWLNHQDKRKLLAFLFYEVLRNEPEKKRSLMNTELFKILYDPSLGEFPQEKEESKSLWKEFQSSFARKDNVFEHIRFSLVAELRRVSLSQNMGLQPVSLPSRGRKTQVAIRATEEFLDAFMQVDLNSCLDIHYFESLLLLLRSIMYTDENTTDSRIELMQSVQRLEDVMRERLDAYYRHKLTRELLQEKHNGRYMWLSSEEIKAKIQLYDEICTNDIYRNVKKDFSYL